jgi:ADP-ribose pyrophosphatase YjhB (NUDIX family)
MSTIGVDITIFNQQQETILLTRRNDYPIWCLPGGGIDTGETIAQAALRETEEETGLIVKLTRLVGVYSRPHWWEGGGHTIVFAAEAIGGELGHTDGEVTAIQYCSIADLPTDLLWWHRQCIEDGWNRSSTVACHQNAVWSVPMTRAEAIEGRDEGTISMQYFVDLFCTPPTTNANRLEVW